MRKETKSQIDAMMGKYEKRLGESKKVSEQTAREEETFLNEFKRLRKEVIRPVMEDIGNQLEARGHKFRISEREESIGGYGRVENAEITMRILPAGPDWSTHRPESTPHISFTATKYKKKISIHGSSMMPHRGGSGGPRGDFNTEEITSDMIEKEVLDILKEIFDR